MKVNVDAVLLNDDGLPMKRAIKNPADSAEPTPEAPMLGMLRVPHTVGALMREALNSAAFNEANKDDDAKRRVAFIAKLIRKGGVVDIKKPGWEVVLNALRAYGVLAIYYAQVREAIYPNEVYADDSIVDPPDAPG